LTRREEDAISRAGDYYLKYSIRNRAIPDLAFNLVIYYWGIIKLGPPRVSVSISLFYIPFLSERKGKGMVQPPFS
jgi:hypothetical protein